MNVDLEKEKPVPGTGPSGEKIRTLLRRLRDLNLVTGRLALGGDRSAALEGCLSLDAPVEQGVRYALIEGGKRAVLELVWRSERLEIAIGGPGATPRRLALEASLDRQGRACVPSLRARVGPESRDRRELEHFLRRVVRTLCA